jgi:predicted aspartyl protease
MNLVFSAPVGRRFTILVWLVVVVLSAGGAAARSPISLDVLRRAGYGSVDLMKCGQNQLCVAAQINGRKVTLLLDTGWGSDGISVRMNPSDLGITPEKGGIVALTVSGAQMPMGRGTARSVVMGNVQVQGTPIYFGRVAGSGFLGRGFLKRNNAIIDLTNLRLYLRPGKGRRVDLGPALTTIGMTRVPFFDLQGTYVVNVEVNGLPTKMALDTGAQFTTMDVRFAKAASARAWGRRDMFSIDAAGVLTPSDFAGTKSFKIEGVPIRTPTVFITKFAGYDLTRGKMSGLLGLDVIGMNWGIIDVAQQKFYFTQAR